MTARPRRASSMEKLAIVSLLRSKPGQTTTSGTGVDAVAFFGLNKSAASHCPLVVAKFRPETSTLPKSVCSNRAPNPPMKTSKSASKSCRVWRLGLVGGVVPGMVVKFGFNSHRDFALRMDSRTAESVSFMSYDARRTLPTLSRMTIFTV